MRAVSRQRVAALGQLALAGAPKKFYICAAMRKLDLRLLPLAVALVAAGCFTPANYGEGVKDSKGHGHEGAAPAEHAEGEHGEAGHGEAEAAPIVEGIIPGTTARKLDLDTPRIEFEAPFDGEPKTSTKLANGVLVEDFEDGSGEAVVEGKIVEFHFKGYSASSNRQVMGSRIAPMRLLLNQASRERDPMTNAMIDAILGAKAGGKRRVKVPSSIVDKDLPPGRPPMGDLWVCLDIVKIENIPVLQPADAYTGEAVASKKHSNGLQTFDYAAGEGREAKLGDRVVVHYIGQLDDGTVFDQSHERADGLNVILGAGGVIEGMAQGLDGVRVGMRRKIVIPPEIGYGAQANGPIPANSTLTFLIEVMTVEDGPPLAAPPGMPGPPPGVGGPGGPAGAPPPAPPPAPPTEPG